MKIRYASDLHVDLNTQFYSITKEEIIKKLNLENIDLLILAGDTAEYPYNLHFCEDVMDLYPNLKIIEIAGNHLYYSCHKRLISMDVIDDLCRMFADIHENYYFLNNDTVILNGIKFIGSTMWTRLGEYFGHVKRIVSSMNDFRTILDNNLDNITADYIMKKHDKSIKFIIKEINNSEGECIVITHHAPFLKLYSSISHAYGINLQNKLKYLKKYPKYWIYGHTKENEDKILEFKRGRIECICNQLGCFEESKYGSQFNSWKTYKENKEIEL